MFDFDFAMSKEEWEKQFGLCVETDHRRAAQPPTKASPVLVPPQNKDSTSKLDADARMDSLPWKSASSFAKQSFSEMVKEYRNKKRYDIGFPNMGDHGVLLPCLLILGAESSVGKTTFLTQIADRLSMSGKKVLLFSLEQPTFEIVSKGISRTIALKTVDEGKPLQKVPSAEALRVGKESVSSEIQSMYDNRAKNVFIVDTLYKAKVGEVTKAIDKFCETYPNDDPPVVIIDYFQILSTDAGGEKTKASFDAILADLRACQRKHDLLMMVISSINRAHYGVPVSPASFKETGNIEYDADIIWGLQFSTVASKEYQSAKGATQTTMLQKARTDNPRIIDLTVLKARGRDLPTFQFKYYPNCDLFLEVSSEKNDEDEKECTSGMDSSPDDEIVPE